MTAKEALREALRRIEALEGDDNYGTLVPQSVVLGIIEDMLEELERA